MSYMESKMQEQYEAAEAEREEMSDRLHPPYDWQNPKWDITDRIHNWRNYASDDLKDEWLSMSGKQRMIIASCLDEIASGEHWD